VDSAQALIIIALRAKAVETAIDHLQPKMVAVVTSQESIDDMFVGCMPFRDRGVEFRWHPMDDSMQIAATERQLAVQWMTDREKEVARWNGDSQKLAALIGVLNAPPAFLPAEEQNRLDNCRREAQRRVDSDEVLQVEMHFRRIADPEMRTECLQRLHRLVEVAVSP
jgi:hypothetical protein